MTDSKQTADFKVMWDNQRFAKATSKIEGITGIYAQHMLVQAGLRDYPKEQPLVVLDNACGGGILTLQLQAILQDRPQDTFEVTDGDLAEAMVELAQQRIDKEGWTNTKATKVDAGDTKLPSEHFTHVLTNFGIMAFANPSESLAECHRILRPGGTCAFTTWGSIPWLEDMKKAMKSIPELPDLPENMDVPNIFSKEKIWHDPEAVRKYVSERGFSGVESKLVPAVSVLDNPDELMTILKPPYTLMSKFIWTQEQRDKFDTQETQDKILTWFENKLKDGPMEWNWSAVITTSTKPSQ